MDSSWIKNIIEKINIYFSFKRVNSPNVNNSKKVSIKDDHSQIIKAKNINVFLNNTEEIATKIIEQSPNIFKDIAIDIFNKRKEEFKGLLFTEFKKLSIEELEKFKNPEVQYSLVEATRISGLREEEDLRNILAKLVIGKIREKASDRKDFKNIIYNESIKTVEKLTINQIKIITLCFLLNDVYYTGIKSIEDFKNYQENTIKPFLNFDNNISDFEYIDYSGCAILLDVAEWDYLGIVRERWPHIFLYPVSEEEYKSIELDAETKSAIFLKRDDRFYFNFYNFYGRFNDNFNDLKIYLSSKLINENLIKWIINLFQSHTKNNNDIQKDLLNLSETTKRIVEVHRQTKLKNIRLTTIGKVIAITNYEQVNGERLDLDIFI